MFALIGRAKARTSKAKGLEPLPSAKLNATVFYLQIQLSKRKIVFLFGVALLVIFAISGCAGATSNEIGKADNTEIETSQPEEIVTNMEEGQDNTEVLEQDEPQDADTTIENNQDNSDLEEAVVDEATIDAEEPTYSYILNTNPSRMKFHYPDCPSVKKMKDENKLSFEGTYQEVLDMGYAPCQECNPRP